MKHGRPAVYLGAGMKHLRIRYINLKGRTRGFYARWRPNLQAWECHLTGYGLQHRQWFSKSQTLALCRLRMTPSLWDWRKKVIDTSVRWDGIEDTGFQVDGKGPSHLYEADSVDPQPEPVRTLPATSLDRIKSLFGVAA